MEIGRNKFLPCPGLPCPFFTFEVFFSVVHFDAVVLSFSLTAHPFPLDAFLSFPRLDEAGVAALHVAVRGTRRREENGRGMEWRRRGQG